MRLHHAAILIAAGCGDPEPLPPVGQVVLYVDTDAVLPPPEGSPPEPLLAPLWLFDRMTIEVFAPGAVEPCSGCTREFAIDREMFELGRASIGIAPEPGEDGYRARVRIFRKETVRENQPIARSLEATVALPVVAEEGIVETHVFLATDALDAPAGTPDAPSAPIQGKAPASRVGTWPRAARSDCSLAPLPGEVCIPGGAYWMGERDVVGAIRDGDEQRLVALAPFFLDAAELTVAGARAAGLSPTAWTGSLDGNASRDWCTFTLAPDRNDTRAVNCLDWSQAQSYCLSRGADLPSEAQWEYAARALGRHRYAWGSDLPACQDAVWGHGILLEVGGGSAEFPPVCPVPYVLGGPIEPGWGARDRLALPGGVVLDLAGNVSEWMRDVWNAQDEACWSQPGVLVDPVCTMPGALGPALRSVRGDSFAVTTTMTSAAGRTYEHENGTLPLYGVRCARPGR